MDQGRRAVALLAIVIVFFPTAFAQSDTEPPSLEGLSLDHDSVDVTMGGGGVAVLATLQDSPAGVQRVRCHLLSPSGGQRQIGFGYSPDSGDIYSGVWDCPVVIPQYAEEGAWVVEWLALLDLAGNEETYNQGELETLGYDIELQVISEPDVAPPSLEDLSLDHDSVDVTMGAAGVRVLAALQDSPAGVQRVRCHFLSPSGGQRQIGFGYSPDSGDIYNGVWDCPVVIPRYAEEGTWVVEWLALLDFAANEETYNQGELETLGHDIYLQVGFLDGLPTADLTSPTSGSQVRGNSVTVRARLASGSPSDISPVLGVRFDYRDLPFGEFTPIPARNVNHPNPDTTYPFFTHWDLSEVPEGDYELRAIAHDLAGTPDPAPETITITIDHAGPTDVEEYVNTEGRQENQTAVGSATENKVASGDNTVASTATELTLPPGSLLYTTDTAKLVYLDPAGEEGQLEQPGQSIGAFVGLSLLSGQADLEAGLSGDLNISYSDANQDGVVDGTSIREEDLELRRLDTGTNSYLTVPSIVLTEHNMVHAEPGFLGKFALAGPLMPRMWVEADKETLTWGAVSSATSYVAYRGLLSALVDVDADGLPDAAYGDCVSHLDIDPADLVFVDSENPAAGAGLFYLVGFVGPNGPGGLGNTSAGLRREAAIWCP